MINGDATAWQCPAESTIPAAQWVAAQPQPPVEEFRQKTRAIFVWIEPEAVTQSRVDPDVARALGELGFRVRWRYRSKSVSGAQGKSSALFPAEHEWEHWHSDDGITSATVLLDDVVPRIGGIETRLEGGMLVHGQPKPSVPGREYHVLTGDPVADYLSHRARVRERVEAGEGALSIADPADREAYWAYYADYLSGKELADTMNMMAELPTVESGSRSSFWFWIAGPIVLLIAILLGAVVWMWGSVGSYAAWLAVWWPILVVTALASTLTRAAVLAFEGHLNHLDHKYPDALDEHAGYWVKRRIAAAGLSEQIEVGKAKEPGLAGLDAYLPLRDKIVLGHKTYDKQDPTFWAIAAHELGHALDFRARPMMRPLSLGSRVATRQFVYWANAVLLANVFFGWALANQVWWWLLVAALVTGAVVLVDEAIASRIGLRILREDERITDAMMVDLRRHLGLAFATYCAPMVAIVGLLLGADWIASYVETHAVFEPAEPLHPGRTDLGNVLSVLVLLGTLAAERKRLGRWWRRLSGRDPIPAAEQTHVCPVCARRFPAEVENCPEHDVPLVEQPESKSIAAGCLAGIAGFAAAAMFFLEVWDQPLGPWYRAAVFAYVPIVLLLLTPAVLPVTLLLNLPLMLAKRLLPKEPRQARAARARAAAADVVAEVQVVDPRQRPPWYLDVMPGLFLYALPLVVLWWASQL